MPWADARARDIAPATSTKAKTRVDRDSVYMAAPVGSERRTGTTSRLQWPQRAQWFQTLTCVCPRRARHARYADKRSVCPVAFESVSKRSLRPSQERPDDYSKPIQNKGCPRLSQQRPGDLQNNSNKRWELLADLLTPLGHGGGTGAPHKEARQQENQCASSPAVLATSRGTCGVRAAARANARVSVSTDGSAVSCCSASVAPSRASDWIASRRTWRSSSRSNGTSAATASRPPLLPSAAIASWRTRGRSSRSNAG